jgi:hypothetical protein
LNFKIINDNAYSKKMKHILVALILVCGIAPVFAQANCAQTLRLANSVYEQGRLHEIPTLLDDCLRGTNLDDAQKVQAYRLLTLTYIYLEEPEKADETMLKLLQTNHEFQINEAVDPAEFVALYKTFRTNPIYRLGGKAGVVITQPNVISSETVVNGTSEYSYRLGFQAGVVGEIPITSKLALNPELSFQGRSFKNIVTVNPGNGSNFEAEGIETQAWVSLPVQAQYEFWQKKNVYYVASGFSVDYLLSSNVTITRLRGEFSAVDERSFDLREQRNKTNYAWLLSAGLKRKTGPGLVVVEARYWWGLRAALTKEDVFENQPMINDYHYVDALFNLRALTISAGYVLNIYNPKKLSAQKK